MTVTIGRRELLAALGGAVVWPLAARAQQGEHIRQIAVFMGTAGSAPDLANIDAFFKRLDELGWHRWWTNGPEHMRLVAAEMIALSPDVIVVFSNLALAVLKPLSGNVPIVFVGIGDPVGSGFVASLAQPGANITGFTSHEGPMGGKWLEMLKETAPRLTRILTIFHPETPVHQAMWRSAQDAAPHFRVEILPGAIHDAAEIEMAISSFVAQGNGGLIVLPHLLASAHRDLLVKLQLRHSLAAIAADPGHARAGCLLSYGVDFEDSFRRTAEYVDRILRGENPANLPVQQPTKYKLVINLKTAKALGLDIPPILLARADEVIE
jgi:putative tryptophan/tyrosine transport system substrate-binding protein